MADFLNWLKTWHEAIPLFGALITASTTAAAAILATWSLNRSIKQTEFFLKFTERFHGIMQSKSKFELGLLGAAGQGHATAVAATEPGTNAADQGQAAEPAGSGRDTPPAAATAASEQEAYELYRQLFGLMFDEFFAYKGGFLARDALVEWMRWRTYAYRNVAGAQFAIGPVSYKDAWDQHTRSPVVQSEFVNFLGEIHRIDPAHGQLQARIRRVVWRHTPWGTLKRFLSWLWTCAKWAAVTVAGASALYAALRWGWPAIEGLIRSGLAMLGTP
jgi:hypothetical protein